MCHKLIEEAIFGAGVLDNLHVAKENKHCKRIFCIGKCVGLALRIFIHTLGEVKVNFPDSRILNHQHFPDLSRRSENTLNFPDFSGTYKPWRMSILAALSFCIQSIFMNYYVISNNENNSLNLNMLTIKIFVPNKFLEPDFQKRFFKSKWTYIFPVYIPINRL